MIQRYFQGRMNCESPAVKGLAVLAVSGLGKYADRTVRNEVSPPLGCGA